MAKSNLKIEVAVDPEGLEALREFEAAEHNPFSIETLLSSVHYLHHNRKHLTKVMTDLLSQCMPPEDEMDLDLHKLVKDQLRSAVSLKNSYFSPATGKLLEGASSREAKDALASCQQVINVLMKQQEELDRNSRLLTIENIVMHVMNDQDEEIKKSFLDQINRQLGDIK
jgi:hypothetical protein